MTSVSIGSIFACVTVDRSGKIALPSELNTVRRLRLPASVFSEASSRLPKG